LGISSFGQKIKFSDSTNVWRYYEWSSAIPVTPTLYIDSYAHDTVIYGIQYEKLNHLFQTDGGLVFIREDSASKKVYAIWNTYPDYDSTEQLLYDYTLNLNDTFRSKHAVHYVSGIDSVLINSTWHKVWDFFPYSHDSATMGSVNNQYYVIEGIGCVNNPCFSLSPFSFETITDLTCFNNHGTTPSLSSTVGDYFNNTTSCSLTFGLEVKNIANKNEIVNIFPNPATTSLTITSTNTIKHITVTNLLGQILYICNYNTEQVEIDVAYLPSGVYFVKINGTEVRNFVKQ